ncbi:uncharacterized protein K441DRAFT_201395 [Cenococcum geophilum 1.58]|uniref:uncharacterized protein n=1 Tax=Cenococcum geophilum 1.58 TaxID=794803 RepID=UPI00359001F0|nr:hypothetical protein K441DRAFT_201395 [Cenococcum geophilum 1.58]
MMKQHVLSSLAFWRVVPGFAPFHPLNTLQRPQRKIGIQTDANFPISQQKAHRGRGTRARKGVCEVCHPIHWKSG